MPTKIPRRWQIILSGRTAPLENNHRFKDTLNYVYFSAGKGEGSVTYVYVELPLPYSHGQVTQILSRMFYDHTMLQVRPMRNPVEILLDGNLDKNSIINSTIPSLQNQVLLRQLPHKKYKNLDYLGTTEEGGVQEDSDDAADPTQETQEETQEEN